MGLDDIYMVVRFNILSTTPLPSINKAYSLAYQEERIRNVLGSKEVKGEIVRFKANTGRKDKNVVCKHCNREGHDAEGCFQLIGYP